MFAIFLTLAILAPHIAFAADDSPFNPDFLISDEEIQNWRAMTRDDVQAFLYEHGGYIARLIGPDIDGVMRTAADMIIRAAETHRINPKYILVKLQKEQSLVTEPNPTQKQLDWATGYGICDACSMNDPSLQKHRGFATQVDSAAGIMRWYYDNVNISPIVKKPHTAYPIDNTLVRPANFATAFLYTYTPHIHGNKNFWLLWQKWFEQSYPDGTLAKSNGSPTVYLVQGGQKRPFATMTALASRFDPERIITIPDSELARYETGAAISLPNYSILKKDTRYYLLDFDTLRPFADAGVLPQLGFHPDEVIEVTDTDIAGLALGATITADTTDPIGALVRVKENNTLYYLKDKTYAYISHPAIAKSRFPELAITDIAAKDMETHAAAAPLLFGDGVLFGIKGDNKIYVTEHGRKRYIPTEQVFLALGYSWNDVVWVDEFTGLNHPTGSPMSAPKATVIASTPENAAPSANAQQSSVMVDVPDADTTFVGQIFATPIDTYLVADTDGNVLAGKNIDTIRPMASFAKVMTAYQLLKDGLMLSKSSVYDPKIHKTPYANFRIAAGEKTLNEHLLYSLLVSSLNAPANILASTVEKNPNAFVARLNEQAKALGLTKTNFADMNGESVDTKTTAREYLAVYRKATDNIDIRRILGLPFYEYTELVDIDGKPRHYDYHSNELMEKNNLPFRILASKTGYLDEAGAGLAMTIERASDKKQFILLTMGNPDQSRKFDEPERFARWVIANF